MKSELKNRCECPSTHLDGEGEGEGGCVGEGLNRSVHSSHTHTLKTLKGDKYALSFLKSFNNAIKNEKTDKIQCSFLFFYSDSEEIKIQCYKP
jgi:hypothetical protein